MVTTIDHTKSRAGLQLQGGDALRVVATLAVILIHVAMRIMDQKPDPSTMVWWAANFFVAVSRWCVPVFVLLSGALLLDPAKDQSAASFYQKRIRRIGGALFFWSLGYLILDILVSEPMGVRGLVWRALTGTPYYHLWFVYMIVGLYAVTPLLRIFVKHASDGQRWGLVILLLIMSVGQDAFEALTSAQRSIFVLTRFVPFLGYYVCGYQLRTLHVSKLRIWPLISIAMICVILIVFSSYWLGQWFGGHRSWYPFGYCSPLVMISSLAIFFWAIKISPFVDQDHLVSKFVGHLAACSLGIYLVHPLIIAILNRVGFDAQKMFVPVGIPLLTLVVFALSYLLVVVMRQIPFVRQTI